MLRLAIEPDEPPPTPTPLRTLAGLLGPRGSRAAVAAVTVLGLSLLIVSGLPARLRAWVHDLPEYAWSTDRIEFDPSPPPWIAGGRDGLIEAASRSLADLNGRSVLDLPLDAIERAFKHLGGIDSVVAVRRAYPDRVAVTLRYRGRPVAFARLPGPEGPTDYVVDGSGMILTALADAEAAGLGPLIRLNGLDAPADASPGAVWCLDDPTDTPNPTAIGAARLARFLIEGFDTLGAPEAADGSALRIVEIQPLGRESSRKQLVEEAAARGDVITPDDVSPEAIREVQARNLYVRFALPDGPTFWVRWRNPPGSENPDDEPSAPEKLRTFRDWLDSGTELPPPPGSLDFSRRGASWADPL